jgi:hypothetical protein
MEMLKLSHIGAIAALTLLGAPLLSAGACSSESASTYVGLGATGCTITFDGVTLNFADFTFTQNASGTGSGGTATSIFLTPDTTGGAGFDITNPGGAWSANATAVNDDDIQYVVTVVGGADALNGLSISETGSAGAGFTPGKDTITETWCPGSVTEPAGSCAGAPGGLGYSNGGNLQITGPASGVTASQTEAFALTDSLTVDKDIQISGNNGGASLTDVTNLVTLATPEPSTLGFLAIAFCGLVGFKKYQQKKTA